MKTLVILFAFLFVQAGFGEYIDPETARAIQKEIDSRNAAMNIGNQGFDHHAGQMSNNVSDRITQSGVNNENVCKEVGTIPYVKSCIPEQENASCDCEHANTAKKNLYNNSLEASMENDSNGEGDKDDDKDNNGNSGITSIDGSYQCDNSGSFNQDYEACKNVISIYNGIYVFEKATLTFEQTEMSNFTQNLERQSQLDAQVGNIQSKSMDYNIAMLEKKIALANRRLSFYTVETTALAIGLKSEWPNKNRILRKCVTGSSEKVEGQTVDLSNELDPMVSTCDKLMALYKNELYKNDHILQGLLGFEAQMVQKMASTNSQIRGYKQNIANLRALQENAFAQDGSIAPQGYSTLCQNNPNDPSCQLGGGRPELATFGEAGMNFQQGSGGNFGFDANNPIAGNSDTETNNDLAEGLESILGGPEGGSGSSKPIDAPRAAKNEPPSPVAGGGGGGSGGGGGGASAPGITPEDEAGTAPKEAKKDLKVASFNPYGRGKKRGIRIFSGSSKEKGNKYNPKDILSKLTSKKKKRSVASMDELSKDIGLFKKISGRYAQLSKEKQIAMPEKKSGK